MISDLLDLDFGPFIAKIDTFIYQTTVCPGKTPINTFDSWQPIMYRKTKHVKELDFISGITFDELTVLKYFWDFAVLKQMTGLCELMYTRI